MSTLHLGRARLKRDAPVDALARLLLPAESDARTVAAHSLVWALFADGAARRRDFLWREEKPGVFMTLSARPPKDALGLFDLDYQEFAPALAVGDRLRFCLRANATVARSGVAGARSARSDVVMDAVYALPQGARAEARRQAIVTAGRGWIAAQGARCGFTPDADVAVDGYDRRRLPRQGGADLRFSSIDLEGRLTVTDPALFLRHIALGFGRAKAFGCGLMLIRRTS
jgi:CRISPR system Cascade subunit CasE